MKAVFLSAAFALAGCATPPPPPEQAGKAVQCHREKPPGLLRTVTVCRSVEESAQRDKESREFIENMRQPPATDRTIGR